MSIISTILGVLRDLRIGITKILAKTQFHGKPLFLIYNLRGYKFNDTYTILDTVKPGDILLRTYDNYLSSLLIPGTWCHAAIATDNKTVINAIGEGVQYTDMIQFCRTDKICILRSNASSEQLSKVLDLAKSELGKQYDYDFIAINNNKFYCSKLVAFCFASVINITPKATKLLGFIPGPKEIIPDDIFNCKDLNVVFNSLSIQ